MKFINTRHQSRVQFGIKRQLLDAASVCSLLVILLILSASRAQAAVPMANTVKEQFSIFEVAMENVANQYGRDNRQVLTQLQKIEPQATALKDFAILSAYRCYLTTQLKDMAALQTALANLKNKAPENSAKPAVQAAIELCQMYAEEDPQKRDQHLARAFYLIKPTQAATLRYWISTMYIELTTKQGRARDAIDAAKIALGIARANNDRFRQAGSLRSLAMVEVDFGDKRDALNHIEEAVALYHEINPTWSNTTGLLNRAYILMSLKRYEDALKAYREVELVAIKQKEDTVPPIVWSNYADIAYAQGNFQRAHKEIKRLLEWSEQHKDVFLNSYAKMTAALLAVESKNLEHAQALFTEALEIFQKEDHQVEIRDFYGNLATAYFKNGYYKQAYAALEKKLELSAKIEQDSRGHAANELRELLKTEERIKENLSLQAEVEKSRLNIQRWVFLALLLLLALAWSARLFLQARKRNSDLLVENKELDYQRFQDPLTQLFNRRYVMENSAAIWEKIQHQSAAILIIDADHFKKINDNYGHPAGDAALIEIARRIKLTMRDSDIVVRWGGEEFLVCSFSCNAEQARLMVGRVLEELRNSPIEFSGKTIALSASIGYVLAPLHSSVKAQMSGPMSGSIKGQMKASINFDDSVQLADAALYLAKTTGRNRAVGVEKISLSQRTHTELCEQLAQAASAGEVQLKETLGPVMDVDKNI
ncbi:tetratricopeptide repeat-containing diguanylate cyclase [Undibacterium flavidum]|uniref:diguanylate cyclase n=1 Tax=Undibacterium flavidum TaxID=2762297 RepID=A0ABR6Y7C0_9BURK|nr:tetratricopeptide repeat-containing diguanylate cyclase [Undibacterium flavidum]MBC3872518.1 GGDEF domain-containing protein [Undibacterium flavidum]